MLAGRSVTISTDPRITGHKTPVTVIWEVTNRHVHLSVRRGIERIRWLVPQQQVCWTPEVIDQMAELRKQLG